MQMLYEYFLFLYFAAVHKGLDKTVAIFILLQSQLCDNKVKVEVWHTVIGTILIVRSSDSST